MSHPAGLPDLFIDRSLGRKKVPAILRGAGLRMRTLAEVYGVPGDQGIQDVVWLERAGTEPLYTGPSDGYQVRVDVRTGRGLVEVSELTRGGTTVRTARFMASRVLALVEHPAA